MTLKKLMATLAVVALGILPMTTEAASKAPDLKPARIERVTDKQGGLDMTYFQVKDLENVTARHAINRAIINAVGDLIVEHKSELEANNCTMTITPEIRHNDYGILSATFTSEGMVKGAAHGFKSMKSINYSYITGDEVTVKALNDLYKAVKEPPAYTAANIDKAVRAEAKAGKFDLITGYKGIEKLPPFYLTGNGLDVYAFFQPYEVAPYVAGIVTVKID